MRRYRLFWYREQGWDQEETVRLDRCGLKRRELMCFSRAVFLSSSSLETRDRTPKSGPLLRPPRGNSTERQGEMTFRPERPSWTFSPVC